MGEFVATAIAVLEGACVGEIELSFDSFVEGRKFVRAWQANDKILNMIMNEANLFMAFSSRVLLLESMPLANFPNSCFTIRFFARVWVTQSGILVEPGVGQSVKDGGGAVSNIHRIVATFKHKDDPAVAVFFRQPDH